ncbi:GntR family transcriptional regulator [Hoeflea sp. CAU 1731]
MVAEAKYERIAAVLESEIRSGRVIAGDAIASESELVRRFSVSRNTVRKGLGILAEKGLIAARVGSGSFVTYKGELIDDASGWTVALSSRDARLQSRIIRLARAPMDFAEAGIPEGTDCLHVDRLRFLLETGRGVSLERSRIPWRESLGDVPDRGLTNGSLTATLEERGLIRARGQEWAGVERSLGEADARLLGRPPGEPMLKLRRLTRAADGSITEYVESLLDPDLFGLRMEF